MPPSADHIKRVNTRYHDEAANSYDTKWGIDFGVVGQDQVRRKLARALGGLPGVQFGDALEIGAGTGYFSLNLLQAGIVRRSTATDISAGMVATLDATPRPRGLAGFPGRGQGPGLP